MSHGDFKDHLSGNYGVTNFSLDGILNIVTLAEDVFLDLY